MTATEPPYPIPPDDDGLLAQCRVETFRAGGKGGQHQNTTDSGVRLIHEPSGIRAESRKERSQLQNRRRALSALRTKLERANHRPTPRTATKVPRSQKKKRREEKRRRGETKRLRRRPDSDAD